MEIGNLTNILLPRPQQPTNQDEADLDFCDLNPNICGMEAGCYSPDGSTYICICHDLLPAGPDNDCDRSPSKRERPPVNVPEGSSSTPRPLKIAPTDGAFGSHQLLDMLATVNQSPTNTTETNHTDSNATSSKISHSGSSHSLTSALVACLLAFCLICLASKLLLLYRKRYKKRALREMPRTARRRQQEPAALSFSMQQYIPNPNYYSSSPETPLMRHMERLQIPAESVTLLEEIGEGCFGKVHKGVYTNPSGESVTVAVKTLKENCNADAQADFDREVSIMTSFTHENILKLEGIVKKDNLPSPWMVFEFMQHGDLAQLLRSSSPFLRSQSRNSLNLQQSDLIRISTQIASGMLYLSTQHFVHRDLATRNCLVGENLAVKISDFGMSRDIYTSDYYKVGGSRMLPIRWMAPESITYGKFSLESDVWAYGVVLWEIFTFGKQPYYGHSNDEVVKLILQGILLQPPENCPANVCSIMAGSWKTEPLDRLTFAEIHRTITADPVHHYIEVITHHPPVTQASSEVPTDAENYLIPSFASDESLYESPAGPCTIPQH